MDIDHLNNCLKYACANGYEDIIELMLKNGAKNYDGGLISASIKNHINIMINMEKLGASINNVFGEVCKLGNKVSVNYLIRMGANNWNDGLMGACEGGHIEIAGIMVDNGATNFNRALEIACCYNQIQMVKLMKDYGADDFNRGLRSAGENDNKEIAEYLVSLGATHNLIKWFGKEWLSLDIT